MSEDYGRWAFLAGLIIVLVMSFMSGLEWIVALLALIAIVVVAYNVDKTEEQKFIWIVIALLLAGGFGWLANAMGGIPMLGQPIASILGNLFTYFGLIGIVFLIKIFYDAIKS